MRTDGVGMQTTLYFKNDIPRQVQMNEHREQPTKHQLPIQDEGVVEEDNGLTNPIRTNLQFKYHEDLNEYYVEVVNPLTNEVIKEIPPKKMLDMYAAMASFMGLVIDVKM